jgi:hypothetical protein
MSNDEILALGAALKHADSVSYVVHDVTGFGDKTTYLTEEQIDVINTAFKMMVGEL